MKSTRKAITWLRQIIPKHLDDALGLSGSACLIWGAAQIFVPAGWITAGVLFIAHAFLWGRSRGGDGG